MWSVYSFEVFHKTKYFAKLIVIEIIKPLNIVIRYFTERFTDLEKLNFVIVVGFSLEPMRDSTPAASKNDAQLSSAQN